MESTRLSKIERLLQKELGDIFQRQAQGMHGVLISVSVVRVSPDLSVARAYLSIFPSEKGKEYGVKFKKKIKNYFYIEGRVGDKIIFKSIIKFKPIKA